MSAAELLAMAPLIVLALGAVAVMLSGAFQASTTLLSRLTAAVLAAALFSCLLPQWQLEQPVTSLLQVDAYALGFTVLLLAAGLVITAMAPPSSGNGGETGAYHCLLLLAILGAAVMVHSVHFAALFLGLELLSLALYGLIGYDRRSVEGSEAAIKYLILSAAASSFLIFGMALLYATLGTLNFVVAGSLIASGDIRFDWYTLAGAAMVLCAFGFKLSLAPFHMWTPDVYQGAPAPVAALIATLSKAAAAALLLRLMVTAQLHTHDSVIDALALLAALSILVGNLLALRQRSLRRILAYSSVAHLGYLLVPMIAAGPLATEATAFYLVAYVVTLLIAFGVIAAVEGEGRRFDDLDDFLGLYRNAPLPALLLTLSLLSLAGIPVTAGFMGKFYVFAAGAEASLYTLLTVVIIGSILGLFYYLRVIFVMAQGPQADVPALSRGHGGMLVFLGVLLVSLGVYPAPLIQAIAPGAQQLAASAKTPSQVAGTPKAPQASTRR